MEMSCQEFHPQLPQSVSAGASHFRMLMFFLSVYLPLPTSFFSSFTCCVLKKLIYSHLKVRLQQIFSRTVQHLLQSACLSLLQLDLPFCELLGSTRLHPPRAAVTVTGWEAQPLLGCWDSNTHPHARVTSTSQTEPSSKFPICFCFALLWLLLQAPGWLQLSLMLSLFYPLFPMLPFIQVCYSPCDCQSCLLNP